MSDGTIIGLSVFFLALLAALFLFVVIGKRKIRQERGKATYRWHPQQDFDVVMRGETPMSPGFPELIERRPDSDRSSER